VKITSMTAINMMDVVMRFQDQPLSMLEYGLAGLRMLSEGGMDESRDVQSRVLIAGLLHTGKFLDVAEALAQALFSRTREASDEALLKSVRSVQGGGPRPW
jgi:hypothetical protein